MGKKIADGESVANIVKKVLSSVVLSILGAITLIFGVLYADVTKVAFINEHKSLIIALLTVITALITVVAIVLQAYDKYLVYKITVVTLAIISLSLIVLYVVKVTGFLDNIDSVDDLRAYVASYGRYTVPIFIIIQFLQVIALPIPSLITIGAGVALFGAFYGSLYSIIGILSASILAYFIGKYLGYKVVSWLIGEKSLQKGLQLIKGKDKIALTFMFLFPFFPDDVLCFVAGLSSMSVGYYIVMITLTRVIGVILSSYSLGGKIIPFNTWWGVTLWIFFFVITCVLCVIIYKNGDKIESEIKDFFKRKRKNGKNDTSYRLK